MVFFLFKHKQETNTGERYDPFNPIKIFTSGFTIQTQENVKYILNSGGYLEAQKWGRLVEPEEDNKESSELQDKFGFKELSLDSLVDGKVLCIGTLPFEKGQEIDEYIAESIRTDNGRMKHYHREVKKIMQEFAQNPTINPYISAQCFPLVILYNESAAIANERIGLHLPERTWRFANSKP